jgi:hypothetical protein
MSSRCRFAAPTIVFSGVATRRNQTDMDPVMIAQRLWQHTRLKGVPIRPCARGDGLLTPQLGETWRFDPRPCARGDHEAVTLLVPTDLLGTTTNGRRHGRCRTA